MLLAGYASAFWRGLIAQPEMRGDVDGSGLIAYLAAKPEEDFRLALRMGLDRRLHDLELASTGSAGTANREQLAVLLVQVWQERQVQEGGLAEESQAGAKALVDFFCEPDRLKQQMLAVLSGVWDVFRQRYSGDLVQIRRAVAYHRAQHYPSEFKTAFVAITGRTIPPRLENHLVGVQRVVMAPTRHIGPYVLFSPYGETLYISFNANTAPGRRAAQESIATLYPPLKALADETRLQIVNLLTGGERYVGEIAELLDLSHSSASRHLNLLTAAEILDVRKENNLKYFGLNHGRVHSLIADLQELFHL